MTLCVPSAQADIIAYDVPSGTFEYGAGLAPSSTPEPGALALMAGLGITGSGLVARRRARRK